MIAIDSDRASIRSFDRLTDDVLTVAGIYGPNASGKSNVLDGISWVSEAVRHSLRSWEDQIPRDPFRFGNAIDKPSLFEISLEIEGVRYDYVLDINDSEVVFEALYSYPERRRRMLFEREGVSTQARRGITGLGGARDLLTPTTLFLSAASRFAPNELSVVAREISNIRSLGMRRRSRPRLTLGGGRILPGGSTTRLFDDRADSNQPRLFDPVEELGHFDERSAALSLLKFADLGIDDVEIVFDEGRRVARPQLVHRVDGQDHRFELDEESAGTRTWFGLIGPVLSALRMGHLLLFDEIDASLHPRLSARLLDLFHDPDTNPYGAQLVFTTHDTSLLNNLNRDEVWLTEKGKDGATTLTALSDYGGDKVRKSLNLERAYLQGRFGGVPVLDQTIVREALGLSAVSG